MNLRILYEVKHNINTIRERCKLYMCIVLGIMFTRDPMINVIIEQIKNKIRILALKYRNKSAPNALEVLPIAERIIEIHF